MKHTPLSAIGDHSMAGMACLSRRGFLSGAAALAGLWTLGGRIVLAEPPKPAAAKTRIRLVFSHHRQDAQGKQSEPGWPFLGYDQDARKQELLAKLRAGCPESEFLPATAYNADDARKILETDQEVDGYLAQLKAINPRIRLLPPLHRPEDLDALAAQLQPYAVDASWDILSRETIARCHAKGVKVFSDALGRHERIEDHRQAIEWGIDLIQTDHPLRLLRAIELSAAASR